jgi:hypothetical protein
MALNSVHAADGNWPFANNYALTGLFVGNTVSAAAANTYTTAVNVEPTAAQLWSPPGLTATSGTYPAGYLNQIGKIFRVKAGGMFGITGTPTGNASILLGSTSIATTGTQTGAAATTMTFNMEVTCVVTATGASGTVLSTGWFQYFTTAPVAVTWRVTNGTAGTADTVDLTQAFAFHLSFGWSASSASNNIQVQYFTVEFLN